MLVVVIVRFGEAATEAAGLVLPQPMNEVARNNGRMTDETNR
jgi:hypothetical protein